MLALPFAAEAQQLGNQHSATADRIVNLPYDSGKSTGIKFHITSCTTGGGFSSRIYQRNNDFITHLFLDYSTDGSYLGSTNSSSYPFSNSVLHFAVVSVATTEGVRRPEIKICNHADMAYAVTVAKWEDQGQADDTPESRYYHVRGAAAGVDTGIAFHRSGSTCRYNDVQLVNPPSWLELRKYTASGTPDGAAGMRFTVRMEKDHAEDRQVRLLFKEGVTVAVGQHMATMAVARHLASAGCSGGLDTTVTLVHTLNITDQADWTAQGGENAIEPYDIRSDALGAAGVGLGLTLHRSSEVCRYTSVSLAGDASSFLELRTYSTATRRLVGTPAASLPGVFMQRGVAGDRNVQVFSKSGASVTPGTKAVTIAVQPGARCGFQQGLPSAQTLALQWTVLSPFSSPEAWQLGSGDDAVPDGPFSPRAVSESSDPVPVGVYLHRTSASCSFIHHEILSGHEALDIYLVNPGRTSRTWRGDLAAININFNSAALYFEPGVQLASGSELPVSIQIRPDATCNAGAAVQTLAFTLTMGTAEAWRALAGDVATATMLFQPASLRVSTSPTDTGVRFHRGTSACPQVDVAVGPTAFMELRKYNGGTADGAAAVSLADVRMQASHADDRRVGVQFKAGVTLPPGLFTATVVAKAASGCAHGNAPVPLTLAYELAVLDAWPWRTAAQDNFGTPAQLDRLELEGSGALPTGLRVQRNSRACASTDVALASDAPSYLSLRRYSATGPDGAAARSLAGVNMTGSGAADRHVRVMIAGGTALDVGAAVTVSLTVSANASCSGAAGVPAAQELVGYVLVSGGGLLAEAAMQAGTALAVRALGIETLGAVMARPGAPSGAAASEQLLGMLAAKEAELESGAIDLREFLAGQSFALPLASADGGLPPGLMMWGRAAAYDVGAAVENGPRVDSDLFSGSFGVDYRFREGMLLGLGFGRHELSGRYSNRGSTGSYQLDLNLYQPYAAAQLGPGWLAAYGSQGTGDLLLEIQDGVDRKPSLKADYTGWGLGWYNDIERWDLRLRAGASAGELEFEENRLELNTEAGTARLAVAYAPGRDLVVDIPIQPEVEIAWADEWGDAAGDSSWLLALAFDYAGDGPLQLRTTYRRAVSGGGDHAGAELDVRVDAGRGGLGPSFALRPHYGIEGGADLFAQVAQPTTFAAGDDRGRRLQAEMAWGLPVNGGVLVPYGGWSMERRDHSRRLGLRLDSGAYGDWNLGWRSADSSIDELHLELRIGD